MTQTYQNSQNFFRPDEKLELDRWLSFKKKALDDKFQTYVVSKSRSSTNLFYVTLTFVLMIYEFENFYTTLFGLSLLPCINYFEGKPYIQRLLSEYLVMSILFACIGTGSITEILVALMPSGFLNYHYLKSWKLNIVVYIIELVFLFILKQPCLLESGLAVAINTLLVYNIEKDFKLLWLQLNGYKEILNQCELFFMNSENPIFIVDKEGSIVKSNMKANKIINSADNIYYEGKLQNIFKNDYRSLAFDVITKAIDGVNGECYLLRNRGNTGFFVQAEELIWKNETYARVNFTDWSKHLKFRE